MKKIIYFLLILLLVTELFILAYYSNIKFGTSNSIQPTVSFNNTDTIQSEIVKTIDFAKENDSLIEEKNTIIWKKGRVKILN